jgi:hypothetical protein
MPGYAKELLKTISDDKPLGAHLGKAAFSQLYHEYKKQAENNDSLPLITDENTGWDFKMAMDQLSPEQQVSLYYPYLREVSPQFMEEENPLEVRSRIKMREWYVKFGLTAVMVAVSLLVGAAVAIAVREGKAPSSELIETFLDFATELAKTIFENAKM